MADIVRPGPPRVAPGLCPGGVVIHVYAVPSGELITTSAIAVGDDVDAAAIADAEAFGRTLNDLADGAACLVAYDGDTGERYRAEAWNA